MSATLTEKRLALSGASLMATAGIAGVWLMHRFDPNSTNSLWPACTFHALTGWWCPGCGGTRAMHALAHGDVARAFAMNPLVMLLIPMALGLLAWWWGWRPRWMHRAAQVVSKPWVWIVLLPGFWIARNLPWPPFSWLAPGGFPGA